MYKTIIVPIDLGHVERAAAMIAAARTIGPKAKLILVNAVETIPAYVEAEIAVSYIPELKTRAHEKLKELAEAEGGDVTFEVIEGQAGSAILDIAEKRKADCIVIASHKPGWQDYLIGSTAARVVRHAKCSVMVVR